MDEDEKKELDVVSEPVKKKHVWRWIGIVILFMIIICGVLILLRGNEDTWIKDKYGAWVKHGNPNSTKPAETSTGSVTLWPTSDQPWPMFHGNYNHTGYVDSTGPADNTLKWKYLIGGKVGSGPNSVIVAKDGTLFVAGNNKITALNADGSLKWAKNYVSTQGPALSADGTTLYFDSDKSIIAASALDGTKKWEFATGNNVVFGPTIGSDGVIYQGSWDKYFYAINADGTLKWKYLTKGTISYPPSVDKNGNIYLGGGDAHFGPDGNLYAFDKDGTLLWTYDTKMLRVGSPAIGYDGLIYLPAAPVLFALNTKGELVWKMGPDVTAMTENGAAPVAPCAPPPAPCSSATNAPDNDSATGIEDIAGIITPAITPSGMLYIGTAKGTIYAIDTKTQKTTWTYQTGKNPEQAGVDYGLPSFVMADKEGTSYFGSVDYSFYAIDKDGKVKWSYKTAGKIMEAAPAIAADGTIYFTSEDGYLYAVGK